MAILPFLLADWTSIAFGNGTAPAAWKRSGLQRLLRGSWFQVASRRIHGKSEATRRYLAYLQREACTNATLRKQFHSALRPADPGFAAGPLRSLTGQLPDIRAVQPDCVTLWALALLKWSEKLVDVLLPSPLLGDFTVRDKLLLDEVGTLVRTARGILRRASVHRALGAVQKQLRAIARKLRQRPVVTRPPLAHGKLGAKPSGKDSLLVLFCGLIDPQPLRDAAVRYNWRLREVEPIDPSMKSDPGHFAGCMRAYETAVQEELPDFRAALLWSPLARWPPDAQMRDEAFRTFSEVAREATASKLIVTGFPSLALSDGTLKWLWPVRQIRWQYWKLLYSEGPTGYAGTKNNCYLGESTSGTRLVSAEVLAHTRASGGSAWLSAIDLSALSLYGRAAVQTCPQVYLLEEHWFPHARLGETFATGHQVEVARWVLEEEPQVRCLVQSSELARRVVSMQGLVTPWCFRRALHGSIEALTRWWQEQAPAGQNIMVPLAGSLWAIIRGSSPMPWDHDADLLLASRAEFQFEERFTALAAGLQGIGCALRKGKGVEDMGFFTSEVSCATNNGVVAVLDIFWQGGAKEPQVREWARRHVIFQVPFLGVTATVDHQAVASFVNPTEGAPSFSRKLMRLQEAGGSSSLVPLHCLQEGHNACLPDCRETPDNCDFQDKFVLVDSWLL